LRVALPLDVPLRRRDDAAASSKVVKRAASARRDGSELEAGDQGEEPEGGGKLTSPMVA
jgi:hypothetical protein